MDVGWFEPYFECGAEVLVLFAPADGEEGDVAGEEFVEVAVEGGVHPLRDGAGDVVAELFVRVGGVLCGAIEKAEGLPGGDVFDVEEDGAGFSGVGVYFCLIGAVLGGGLAEAYFRHFAGEG